MENKANSWAYELANVEIVRIESNATGDGEIDLTQVDLWGIYRNMSLVSPIISGISQTQLSWNRTVKKGLKMSRGGWEWDYPDISVYLQQISRRGMDRRRMQLPKLVTAYWCNLNLFQSSDRVSSQSPIGLSYTLRLHPSERLYTYLIQGCNIPTPFE